MASDLSDLQRDTLAEIFNIGVGRAGRILSGMLGCEMAMSVPVILDATPAELRAHTVAQDPALSVCAVTRALSGLTAEGVMIFTAPKGVVEALARTRGEIERPGEDPRSELISRIGFLVLESCLDQIESVIGTPIARDPVQFVGRMPSPLFATIDAAAEIIAVRIDMRLQKHGMSGHLLFAFADKTADSLAAGLDRMLSRTH